MLLVRQKLSMSETKLNHRSLWKIITSKICKRKKNCDSIKQIYDDNNIKIGKTLRILLIPRI